MVVDTDYPMNSVPFFFSAKFWGNVVNGFYGRDVQGRFVGKLRFMLKGHHKGPQVGGVVFQEETSDYWDNSVARDNSSG